MQALSVAVHRVFGGSRTPGSRGSAAVAEATRAVAPAMPVRGDGVLHPIVVGAIVVLLLNDHVLKETLPGVITGKISDFAGLLFFPVFLQAGWERWSWRLSRVADIRVGSAAVVVTGVVFAAIKTSSVAASMYGIGLGWAQWAIGSLPRLVSGVPVGGPHRASIAMDPTDLVALPMLLLAWWTMARRA